MQRTRSVVLLGILMAVPFPVVAAEVAGGYGAEANPTGDPIGGGDGYRRIVERGDFNVATAAELLTALKEARAGQIIYVAQDARIDLTGPIGLQLPAGVTLAGKRGRHGAAGPLIYCDTLPEQRGLFSAGPDSRITGLRIRGPEPAIAQIGEYRRTSTMGISTNTNVEVDNCEISHFNHSGVNIRGKNVRVHHCFIHDVHAYPIVVAHKAELPTLIEANLIHYAWHAIAGSGDPGTGYEARYNRIVAQMPPASWKMPAPGHAFDMHAHRPLEKERKGRVAGDYISIHHNTAQLLDAVGVFIRGVPRDRAEVFHNWFSTPDPATAIRQIKQDGNLWAYDNVYGPDKKPIPLPLECRPRIRFQQPPLPADPPPKVRGEVRLEIEVSVYGPLQLQSVVVQLDQQQIWSGQQGPPPGEITLKTRELTNGEHKLTVTATDNRGVSSQHSAYLAIEN
ncbi:MAG: right-handed parallel beta-helix repeat-containing protein [Candidatus Anammoximicrobium sp.]|nr:right-handed parallel beta-helix repeat-containing protein [Candidatus Anammoximicrobium sp.]